MPELDQAPEARNAAVPVAAPGLDAHQREVVELFVAGARVIGLPRSVGEIYGLMFMEPEPLCLDDLQQRLNLSRGSVSQGLRVLREVGAIRSSYVPGQRKDHFTAETELRRLLGGFLARQVRPHLDSGSNRLRRLQRLGEGADHGLDPARLAHYAKRVQKLAQWHGRTSKLLPFLERFAG